MHIVRGSRDLAFGLGTLFTNQKVRSGSEWHLLQDWEFYLRLNQPENQAMNPDASGDRPPGCSWGVSGSLADGNPTASASPG